MGQCQSPVQTDVNTKNDESVHEIIPVVTIVRPGCPGGTFTEQRIAARLAEVKTRQARMKAMFAASVALSAMDSTHNDPTDECGDSEYQVTMTHDNDFFGAAEGMPDILVCNRC